MLRNLVFYLFSYKKSVCFTHYFIFFLNFSSLPGIFSNYGLRKKYEEKYITLKKNCKAKLRN